MTVSAFVRRAAALVCERRTAQVEWSGGVADGGGGWVAGESQQTRLHRGSTYVTRLSFYKHMRVPAGGFSQVRAALASCGSAGPDICAFGAFVK